MANKAFLIFLSILFFSIDLSAKSADSLVYYRELKFADETASFAFKKFITNTKPDLFHLLINTTQLLSKEKQEIAQVELLEFIATLRDKIALLNEEETVQLIASYTQKKYLKTFKINAAFYELFEVGTYNNLTYMSLQAIILSQLNIPFEIISSPNNISINVFTQQKNIKIESKEMEKKYIEIGSHFSQKFGKALYYDQTISKGAIENNSDEVLINKFFFYSGAIKLQDLAALHYSNNSIYAMNDNKIEVALEEVKKAYALNASKSNYLLLKYHLFNALGMYNYAEISDIERLIYLCRYNNLKDGEINGELIKSEYLRMLNAQLTIKLDYSSSKQFHKRIIENITDTLLRNELNFKYHFEIIKLGLKAKEDKQIKMVDILIAYAIKPENKELQTLITECLTVTLQHLNDSKLVLGVIDDYTSKFLFLGKSNSMIRLKAQCYLDLAANKFNINAIEEGVQYLEIFEKMEKKELIVFDTNTIEKAYLSAARYYFNKGNKSKAKEYLNNGLKYAPDSTILKEKLNLVK